VTRKDSIDAVRVDLEREHRRVSRERERLVGRLALATRLGKHDKAEGLRATLDWLGEEQDRLQEKLGVLRSEAKER
jgi:1,6-anhydro-N-acetylmuramate kinase